MITINQLINVAPFPESTKQQLLAEVDYFSSDKRFEVEETCWALISMDYQNRLQYEQQKAIGEMAKGKKYTSEELKSFEQALILELTRQLTNTETKEALSEVRTKLTSVLSSPEEKVVN